MLNQTSRTFWPLIVALGSFAGCSHRDKSSDYSYPPANPFPSIFLERNSKSGVALEVELDPKTIELDCTLRNDSPYYWCGIDGVIKRPDPKLPKKLSTVYHVVVPKRGEESSKRLVTTLKKSNQRVFVLVNRGPFLSENGNYITGQLLGVFSKDLCMQVFGQDELCPRTSQFFNIFNGKIEELSH